MVVMLQTYKSMDATTTNTNHCLKSSRAHKKQQEAYFLHFRKEKNRPQLHLTYQSTVNKTYSYIQTKKIDKFIIFTTVLIGLVMLIASIWILAYTHPVAAKLAIITAFILFFFSRWYRLGQMRSHLNLWQQLQRTYLPKVLNIYMHRGAALTMIIGTRLSLWFFSSLEVINKTGFCAQVVF